MKQGACDILVVGAGILGAASAYYLKEAMPAEDILLIDRAGVAQGNTGKSVAMVRDTFTSRPSRVLAHASIFQYRLMHAEAPGGIDLNRMMYLWLFDRDHFERNAEAFESLGRLGVDVRLMSVDELKTCAPCVEFAPTDEESAVYGLPPIEAGLLCRNAYSVDPVAIAQWYVTRFKALGGRTLFDADVVDFVRRPCHVLTYEGEELPDQPFPGQAQTVSGVILRDGGTLAAGTTILAAGAWSRELTDRLGKGSLLNPKKRQWFYLESAALAPLFDLPAFGNRDGTLPFTILPQGIYIKPSREGGFYAALADNIGRPFDLDTKPERDYFVNCIHPFLKGYFPQFEDVVIKAMDAGSYCYDEVYRTPIVDWIHDGLMLVSGGSGSGIMKADAIGRVAAHRYARGDPGSGAAAAVLELPGGETIDTNDLTVRGRGRIEPERLVI